MINPNPQPPTATLGAPLDTPSPATQAFHALEPAPFEIVWRQGATRGTGATDQRGPICGTWDQVIEMAQSIWLTAREGPTITIRCDGTDLGNPNPGVCNVPDNGGTVWNLPPNLRFSVARATILEFDQITGAAFRVGFCPTVIECETSISVGGSALVFVNGAAGARVFSPSSTIVPAITFRNVSVTSNGGALVFGGTGSVSIYAFNSTFAAGSFQTAGLALFSVAAYQSSNFQVGSVVPYLGGSIHDASSVVEGGTLGPPVDMPADLAFGVGYSPTTPGDWPIPPITAGQALDDLAATVSGLRVTPSVTYQPGGSPSLGVFTTPRALTDYIASSNATDLPWSIGIDASFVGGAAVWNGESTAFPLPNLTRFYGIPNPLTTALPSLAFVPNGGNDCVLSAVTAIVFENFASVSSANVAAPLIASNAGGYNSLTLSDAPLSVGGSTPILAAIGGGVAAVELNGSSIILAAGGSLLTVDAFSSAALAVNGGGTGAIPAGVIPAPPTGGTVAITATAEGIVDASYPATAGIAVTFAAQAAQVNLAGPPVMHAVTVDAGIYEALSPSIAFLPGAALPVPQYGRVATSWGDLTAQIADSNGTQQMIFVNTNGAIPFVVPSSGTEFYWPVFVGTNAYTAGFPTVDCGSAGFTWFSSIEFQDCNLTSTAGGVAQLDAAVGEAFVRLSGYGSIKSATATACVDVSGAGVVAISLEDDAQLGDGTNPAISGTGVGVCLFFLHGSAQIAANSLDPSILAAGSLSIYAQSSGVTIDASYHPQTLVLAGVTLVGNGSPLVTGLSGGVGAFYLDALTGTLWANPQGNEWVPAVAQSGTTALVNGVSPAIPAYLAAGNAIVVTYNTPATSVGGTLGVLQAALANRVNGAPGSFTVTSVLPTTLAANVTDQSTVDWMVVQ